MLKNTLIIMLLLAGLAAFRTPQAVHADGIGYFPSELKVNDALRGARYETGSAIVNQTGIDLTFKLSADGDIGKWLTFAAPDAPDVLTGEVVVPARSELKFIVYINVPADSQNGAYTGSLLMENFPPDGSQSSAVLAFRQGVNVTVTGTQTLSLQVGSAYTSPVEAGKVLHLFAQVSNGSNVDVAPTVSATIEKQEQATVVQQIGRAMAVGEPIRPGEQATVESTWDTADHPVGDYRATVTVSAQGQSFGTSTVDFRIVPPGTLSSSARISSMSLVGDPPPGSIARVDIVFENTGENELQAHFVGQVYQGDAIVEETASKIEGTALPKANGTISTFFPVTTKGNYSLRGRVVYEGGQTEEQTLSFSVGGGGASESGAPWGAIAGSGALLAVAAVGAVVFARRQRRGGRPVAHPVGVQRGGSREPR